MNLHRLGPAALAALIGCSGCGPSYEVCWTDTFEVGMRPSIGRRIAIDGEDNVYVVGAIEDGLGAPDSVFAVKYDASGAEQWTRRFGSTAAGVAAAAAVDHRGHLYIAGSTSGDFDGQPKISAHDAFVTQFDEAGTKLWTRQFGLEMEGWEDARGVTADGEGNVYVVGGDDHHSYSDNVQYLYGFIVRFTPDGVRQWSRKLDGTHLWAVTTDVEDEVYVAGSADSEDGDVLLVSRLDPSGATRWTHQSGVEHQGRGAVIMVDPAGDVYVGGLRYEPFARHNTSPFLSKFDATGAHQWTHDLPGARELPTLIRSEGEDAVTVCTAGSRELQDGDCSPATENCSSVVWDYDARVACYDAAGEKVWSQTIPSRKRDEVDGADTVALAVAMDSRGDVYMAGSRTEQRNEVLVARFCED